MPVSSEHSDVERGSSQHTDVERGPEQHNGHPGSACRRISNWFSAFFERKSKPASGEVINLDPTDGDWARCTPYVREIQEQVHGWPILCAAIDSDPNFMIYRRFGYLRTRLLTYYQDVLRGIEVTLDDMDKHDRSKKSTSTAMCWREGDDSRQPPLRKELFQSLNRNLKLYDDLLLRSQQLYKFDTPTKRNQQNVRNMIWNDKMLAEEDRDYIRHIDDLITFEADNDSSWVHRVVGFLFSWTGERFTSVILASLSMHFFRDEVQLLKTVGNPLHIRPFQRFKFNRGVEYVFAMSAITSLMGPIYILNAIRDTNGYVQNTAVFISTALFAFFLSSATAAKRHEIFALTSAYCAVLVVFTSQNTNSAQPIARAASVAASTTSATLSP